MIFHDTAKSPTFVNVSDDAFVTTNDATTESDVDRSLDPNAFDAMIA
jgi:hypothetical protein